MVAKVNNIDTIDFVLKTKYQTDKRELEKKITNETDFVKKAKLTELENKILDVSNLAAKIALTAVENKIPSVSDLVKKTNYNTKITEIKKTLTDQNHDKHITPPYFNALAADSFNERLAHANVITKTDFDAKLSSFSRKITANKTKIFYVKNDLHKSEIFDSIYFIGKSHFKEDDTRNYLVFQPISRYSKVIANTDYAWSWKSKGLSAGSIKPPTAYGNSLTPVLNYYGTRTRLKFPGSCLKQPKISYTHGKVGNIYVVYELVTSSSHDNDAAIKSCLFGAVTLTKNADIDR